MSEARTTEKHVTTSTRASKGEAVVERRGRWRSLPALYWITPLAVLVAWEGLSRLGVIPERVLPAPSDVLVVAVELVRSGELVQHLLISLRRMFLGFLIGGGLGLFLGFAVGMSRWAEVLIDRPIQMVRTIPHLALVPLVILWFGIGEEPKVFLVALGSVFPVYLNTAHGIRSVDPRLVEMARSYGLGGAGLVRQVVLPGALPGVLVGIRYALGVAWLTLVVGETIAASSGIGFLAMEAREFVRTDVIVLVVLIYALLGGLSDTVVRHLERIFLRWHPSYGTR